jgi:hypothetical protein
VSRLPPALAHVRSLEGGPFFTRSEVCKAMGISRNFLERNIERNGIVRPKVTLMSSMTIALYDNNDLKTIKAYLDERKRIYQGTESRPGRPRLYDDEQRARRQKIQMRIYYYRKEADKAVGAGNHTRAEQYLKRADQARAELDAIEAEAKGISATKAQSKESKK